MSMEHDVNIAVRRLQCVSARKQRGQLGAAEIAQHGEGKKLCREMRTRATAPDRRGLQITRRTLSNKSGREISVDDCCVFSFVYDERRDRVWWRLEAKVQG
mmetsp:Transcript_53826/g.64779  ORF Transcript_53826/g.64779 Transcript_53826/m.64779 type:complete len:101 (-) Transcript_53826:22-324(-)